MKALIASFNNSLIVVDVVDVTVVVVVVVVEVDSEVVLVVDDSDGADPFEMLVPPEIVKRYQTQDTQ